MSQPTKSTSPEPTFTAAHWAAGNGPLQVPLAGLLAADPELREAELTHADWTARLEEYLKSERS